jgi:hypothetical protein
MKYPGYWQHSFAVATLCQQLARKEDQGIAYLVGLCHDLGEILFFTHFASEYRQVLEHHAATGRPISELEHEMLGLTHGELVSTIMGCLGLPESIRKPIEEYHRRGGLGRGASSPLTLLLRIAELYSNGLFLGSSASSIIGPIARAQCLAATGQENPQRPDSELFRGQIQMLAVMLGRLTPEEQSELLATPTPDKRQRLAIARHPSLSSLDPVQTALESIVTVTVTPTIPSDEALHGAAGLVVMSPGAKARGFGADDVARASAALGAYRTLWLTDRGEVPQPVSGSASLPLTIGRMIEFVQRLSSVKSEARLQNA